MNSCPKSPLADTPVCPQIPDRRLYHVRTSSFRASWVPRSRAVRMTSISVSLSDALRHIHIRLHRILESTLRTTNNLLERLHASFFFYLLVGTTTFMKIGSYLPAAVLVSTAMLFSGLGEWAQARWVQETDVQDDKGKDGASEPGTRWVQRRRPVLPALLFVVATHLNGLLLFALMTIPWVNQYKAVSSSLILSREKSCVNESIRSRILSSQPKSSNSRYSSTSQHPKHRPLIPSPQHTKSSSQ